MGSFSTSLSGIEAASQDLAVISNNLANLDTTAYKDQQANFQDFFYQMLGTDGAGNPTQIGAGSVIGSVISAFTEGTINTTGIPTDMAIQGNGFFLEQNGATTLYTRAGNFSQNASGYLMTSDGGYVLGYPAVNGVISPSQTLAPLQISNGQLIPPNATTDVELTMNLDASATAASSTSATAATATLTVSGQPTSGETVTIDGTKYTFVTSITGVSNANDIPIDATSVANTLTNLADAINGTGIAGTNYTTGTTSLSSTLTATAGTTNLTLTANAAGSAGNNIGVATTWGSFGAGVTTLTGGTDTSSTPASATATFSEPVVVYDSLGNSHTLTFTFTKTAANTWSYKITIPAADVTSASAPVTLTNGTGTLQFGPNGQLITPTANVTSISIANLKDGAETMNFTWQLFDPTTGAPQITQVAGSSNVSSTQQNGYASGALQSFTINSDGTIQGAFSNGQTLTLGQVALATFTNTQGLQLNGANTYLSNPAAGIPSVGAPGAGGRGTIVGEALESSNADMTTELSDLIVAERNYQANARAISTADQMINYVLTMQP
jgi:flagellar hook protein FlgE